MKTVLKGELSVDEQEGDLVRRVREYADRKVARFLDGTARPPFIVAMDLGARLPGVDPARVALFTISEWEPSVPAPPADLQGDAEELARHYQESGNPTDWLRGMPNNALCHSAVVAGFRGPNTHFVGRAPQLPVVLTVAQRALLDGDADATLIVAFDLVGDDPNPPPDLAASRAAAIALVPSDDSDGTVFVSFDALKDDGRSARMALTDVINEAARLRRDNAEAVIEVTLPAHELTSAGPERSA